MTKGEKRSVYIGAAIAALVATGSWLWVQVNKLMHYQIGFKGVRINKISLQRIDMNLFLSFTNPSALTIRLKEQEYDVYLNDVFITTLVNRAENVLKAGATDLIGLNVNFSPAEFIAKMKGNPAQLLNLAGKLKVKIVMRVKVRFGFFSVRIPEYTYEENLSLT